MVTGMRLTGGAVPPVSLKPVTICVLDQDTFNYPLLGTDSIWEDRKTPDMTEKLLTGM